MKSGVIILDPGHGGDINIGGSDANHAVSALGDLEKNLTLSVANRLNAALKAKTHQVFMTRSSDVNLSLQNRAGLSITHKADVFLSIHFNGWNDTTTQGTETFIHTNANDDCKLLASSVQQRLIVATGYNNRGVKSGALGVLRPDYQYLTTSACLAEISFITETKDALRLRDENYLNQLANALSTAIDDFINKRSNIPMDKFIIDTYWNEDLEIL